MINNHIFSPLGFHASQLQSRNYASFTLQRFHKYLCFHPIWFSVQIQESAHDDASHIWLFSIWLWMSRRECIANIWSLANNSLKKDVIKTIYVNKCLEWKKKKMIILTNGKDPRMKMLMLADIFPKKNQIKCAILRKTWSICQLRKVFMIHGNAVLFMSWRQLILNWRC